jgi:hypothetical protein
MCVLKDTECVITGRLDITEKKNKEHEGQDIRITHWFIYIF